MEETLPSELDRFKNKFLSTLAVIVVFGLIMVYSSSYIFSKETFGNPNHFILRQGLFVIGGTILAIVIGKTKFGIWWKYGHHINMVCIALLALTFIPGLGPMVKGARRWISIGGFGLQPGELVKYSIMLSSFYFFENYSRLETNDKIKHGLSISLPLGMLIAQPDFGTFSICFMVIAFTCFMSNFPRRIFYSCLGIGLMGAVMVLISAPYRVQRLLTFMDPWKNPKTSGFQIIQSYLAFANGAFSGLGLGNSNEKLFYLPEAHNDFIFSVVGEELGFLGVAGSVLLFMALIYFGIRLALQLRTRPGVLVVASIVFTIGIQALLNMCVVLGLVPTKGLNLPFISYGGSSLLANFFAIGLVLSAIRHDRSIEEGESLGTASPYSYGQSRVRTGLGPISNF